MERKLNFHYASVHGAYWMYYGVLGGFSSVFLLAKGYSNSEIGVILAAGNILAVLIQTVLAGFADKGRKGTIFLISGGITLLNLALSTMMIFQSGRSLVLTVLFTSCFGLIMANQPFINAINRRLEECGVSIAFGTCRSIGSLAYAVICFFLGTLVEAKGPEILPLVGNGVLLLIILTVYLTYRAYKIGMARNREDLNQVQTNPGEGLVAKDPEKPKEEITLQDFIQKNKMFFVMSLGVLGLYFANTIPNAYMAQIVDNIGGTSEDVGRIFAYLAITEIPTLVLFDRLYQRFSCQSMLKFASVGYVIWIGACGLARNVGMLSLAQLLHFFSFPLFLPAMVRYIDDNMREGEAVRGQTLFMVMTTLGNMLASLVGGVLLDMWGANLLMTAGVVAAVIGAVIIWLMVGRDKNKVKPAA